MIFELPDIFFGSHPKKEMASQPPQVRQYGFIKKLEKALSQADFSKIRSYLFRCNKPKFSAENPLFIRVSALFFFSQCFTEYLFDTNSDTNRYI